LAKIRAAKHIQRRHHHNSNFSTDVMINEKWNDICIIRPSNNLIRRKEGKGRKGKEVRGIIDINKHRIEWKNGIIKCIYHEYRNQSIKEEICIFLKGIRLLSSRFSRS